MINIRFAEDKDAPAIARFNSRLKAGGRIDEMPQSPELPGEAKYRPEGFPIYRQMLIAEEEEEVRAGLMLCHHNVYIHGECHEFCWTKLPLSEGIINPKYSLAIVQVMRKALEKQPFLMGMGAGTSESEGHRFFAKLRWRYQSIPFFFLIVNAGKVMRELTYLHRNPKMKFAALAGAYTGMGAGLSGILALRQKALPVLSSGLSGFATTEVDGFEEWADRIFSEALPDYPVAIRSDATSLNIIYPPDDKRFSRLRVRRKATGADLGWIVIASKQMRDNHYFGNLNVGTLVDGFCKQEYAPTLLRAGINALIEKGVDIIVCNFSHAAWVEGCRRNGMFSGPSNYQIFVSPKGGPVLEDSCPLEKLHMTRGHSDGMDNLL